MTLIEMDSVYMRYRDGPEILSNINCRIEQGMFRFVYGASGAGKSSLLRLFYVDERPFRGMMKVFNHDIHTISREELPSIRRRIGVVFQDFRLVEQFTVFENVALALRVRDQPMKESKLRDQGNAFLEWVGLYDKS